MIAVNKYGAEIAKRIRQADEMEKVVTAALPKPLQNLKKAESFLGTELSTIVINAVGTGLVAPVFIANNPLAKTDEKTKQYSALRQPISAVLSVLMQAGVVIPANMLLNKGIQNGKLGDLYDKSFLQDKSYIVKTLKKEGKVAADGINEAADTIRITQIANEMDKMKKAGVQGDLFQAVLKKVKNVDSNVKWLKAITGLVLAVSTVPVSCTALNWVYPKFVEKFFPDLVKEDKAPQTKEAK